MFAHTLYKMRVTEHQKEAWINQEESSPKQFNKVENVQPEFVKGKIKSDLAKGCGAHFA